jgi:hypothetical protein
VNAFAVKELMIKFFRSVLLLAGVTVVGCIGASSMGRSQSVASSPPSLENMVRNVQTSVVTINISIFDPTKEFSDPELRMWFRSKMALTVGTGFIVNKQGDVVTAQHVLTELRDVANRLKAENIQAVPTLGIVITNTEMGNGSVGSGNAAIFPLRIKVEDVAHDIAVVAPANGDMLSAIPAIRNKNRTLPLPFTETKITYARINLKRPTDGASIFSCGFPLRSDTLVTTSGHVASAWPLSTLKNDTNRGVYELFDVYTLDLHVDHGDSGSPVFLNEDQSVIGMVVETTGSLAKAVPSKSIKSVLDANKIPWTPIMQ